MKSLSTLTAAVALLVGAGAANAADMYAGGGLKDSPVTPFLPEGFYMSVGAGGTLTDTKPSVGSFSLGDFNFAGGAIDLRVGADKRLGNASPWVVGLFAEIGYEGVKGQISGPISGDQDVSWKAGGRLGYAVSNSSLIYGFVAYHGVHLALSNTGASTDLSGIETGAGLEIDLSSFTGKHGVFLGHETGFTWFNDWNPGGSLAGLKVTETELTSKVRLGVRF